MRISIELQSINALREYNLVLLSNAINPRLSLIAVLLLGGIALFAMLVWPTRYRYDHVKMGDNDYPARTDRLSGKAEFLSEYGWHEFPKETSESESQEQEIPTEEVAKLTGQASINYGRIKVALYNGSDWKITEITVLVTVRAATPHGKNAIDWALSDKSKILSRPYRLRLSGYTANPQVNTNFYEDLGFELEDGQTWEWGITAARGSK